MCKQKLWTFCYLLSEVPHIQCWECLEIMCMFLFWFWFCFDLEEVENISSVIIVPVFGNNCFAHGLLYSKRRHTIQFLFRGH